MCLFVCLFVCEALLWWFCWITLSFFFLLGISIFFIWFSEAQWLFCEAWLLVIQSSLRFTPIYWHFLLFICLLVSFFIYLFVYLVVYLWVRLLFYCFFIHLIVKLYSSISKALTIYFAMSYCPFTFPFFNFLSITLNISAEVTSSPCTVMGVTRSRGTRWRPR